MDEVLQEFNPKEQELIAGIQNAADNLTPILGRAVDRALGAVRAGGYALGPDGTVPDQLKDSIIAIARWRWLISLPQVTDSLQNPNRKAAYDEAIKRLEDIANQKENIEPPDDPSGVAPGGNWNSENKLIGRTHPVVPPSTQFQQTDGTRPYANPDDVDS